LSSGPPRHTSLPPVSYIVTIQPHLLQHKPPFRPSKETIFLSLIVILIINQILQKLGVYLLIVCLSIIGIFIKGLLLIVLLYSFIILEIELKPWFL
jgi:hypothetical protein